ncbi:MAG: Ig-like domain-containing protein [bacterium]
MTRMLALLHIFSSIPLIAYEPHLPAASGSPRQNQKIYARSQAQIDLLSRASADSFRQALGLSENVQIVWATSSNGTDTISIVDDFNRSSIGPDWALDSRYWTIRNGELVLTADAVSEWRYLAVFTGVFNDSERKLFSVSYRWGRRADAVGIGEGAFALMLNKPDFDASGYWCWRRTNQKQVWLYAIKNGIWEYTPGASKEYHRAGARTPIPVAGDVVEVVPHKETDGMYFDYYVNGAFDATVVDESQEFANNFPWYAGVFMHGQGLNNQIDDFRVSLTAQDAVAPARVTDLFAREATPTSITLEWTATGDNNFSGPADHYEIRYSTSPITPQNFGSTRMVQDPPWPDDPGQRQDVTVEGLQAARMYYFAMRVFDEVGNVSGLSNVLEVSTNEAGLATELQLIEGCEQTGEVGKPLAQPIVAKVLDQYGVGVSNRSVRFVVMAGGGHVQGSTNIVVPTDGDGRASALWTLGSSPILNKIEIRSIGAGGVPLSGSPIVCIANAVIGSAAHISVTSHHRKLYSVNTATDPIVVRITDAAGNPVAGSVVKFSVLAGAGYLLDGQLPSRKTYQTPAGSNGTATARLNTGAAFGDTTKIAVTVESLTSVVTLQPPLFVVAAPPDSMKVVSGNQQSALLNTALPEPLTVRVFDLTGAPAAGHTVTFSLVSGDGRFGNGTEQQEMTSDSLGFARAALRLGPRPGNSRIEVRSRFGNKALRNTPAIFIATAISGSISASLSALIVAPQNGLLADSVSAATVTVAIYDEHNNPVPGKNVRIRVNGERVFIKQPAAPTDVNGEATAEVRSKKPGFKTIWAMIWPDSVVLADSVRVRFNEIAAARMRLLSGNHQSAPAGTILSQPLAVELTDKFGNPPRPTSVTFTVLTGGGTIIGFRNVSTDSRGQARTVWQLGPLVDIQKLEGRVNDLAGSPVEFVASAKPNAVEEKDEAVPTAFALLQNSPNPFNPETNIYFELPQAAEVELDLYDLNGRFIAKLVNGQKIAGRHQVRWNGRDRHDQPLESGVYIYRLRARHGSGEEFLATRKLTLLK